MSEAKKLRLDTPLIGTHSGTFHADEALAVHLVRKLPQYNNARLVRTRDPEILATCDIVVDVGGEYVPEKNRYDHHQRGFQEVYSPEHKTRLSSAGLIYKHFGVDVIAEHLGLAPDSPQVSTLVGKLYNDFVEAIDAVDNGIGQYEAVDAEGKPTGAEVRARYRSGTSLSSRVGHLNPAWNEPSTSAILDTKFEQASALAGSEFFSRLDYYSKAWLPARSLVVKALEARTSNEVQDPTGRVLVFESYCPWKEHLHNLEAELTPALTADQQPLYALYPDESSKWRIQAIPKSPESFESRKALPEAWRGLRDEALSELTGVPGCIFVHASGFIGGNQTKEGAIEMAKKALAA